MIARGTFVCAVAAVTLLGSSPASAVSTYTETCTNVAVRYQRSIKEGVTAVNSALAEAKARMLSQEFMLVASAADLSFVNEPLNDVMNYTGELSNQFDELNDRTMAALTASLPYGISVGCQVDTTTFDLFLTVAVNATGTVSETVDLSGLPAADLAALGLTFSDPSVSLSGSVFLAGTISITVKTSGTVVSVSGLSAAVTATGAVATNVDWKDVGSVGIAGSVSVTGVTVPVTFPTSTSLSDFVAKLGEVRIGSLTGELSASLAVAVAVDAVPVGQLPTPVLTVYDNNMFDAVLPVVTVDADITSLESTIVELLRQLGSFDIDLGALGLSGLELPNVNVSALVSGVPDMLKLAPVAEQYFLLFVDGSAFPTFSGLVTFLKENLAVPQLTTSVSVSGVNMTGGWFPEAGEVALNIHMELGSTLASESFGGSISSVLGDMQALTAVFDLIGATAPEQSLAVPDFSADVAFSGDVVLDFTVGLKTEFINTGNLTGSALAGNAFLRVNDLSAEVKVAVDPINFEADLLLSQFVVRDGSFEVALGLRADFSAAAAEEVPGAAVSASTVEAVTEITVLELLSGGSTAVLDFVKQLNLEVYATLDAVVPVELTAGFAGSDVSLSPIVELHDESLLSGGLPAFSLDIDLNFLVPSLPGGKGGSGNELDSVMGALTDMLEGISGISLDTASIPNVPQISNLLSGLSGKVSFSTVLTEYLDLLVKFRELANGLGLDLALETVGAEALVSSTSFNTDILGRLQTRFPTVFVNFTSGLTNSYTGVDFSVLDYLRYVQVEFGLAATLASADADFGKNELVWYLAVNVDYSLTKENAWALLNLLELTGYTSDSAGYPVDSLLARFDPAAHLVALQAKLALTSLSTFNLGTLGSYVANSAPTLGVNVNFNKAIFDLLVVTYPDFATKYGNLTVGDLLPMNSVTGAEFDWRNYLTEVGSVLGLSSTASLDVSSVAALFGKRPTVMGLVRFLKSRLLNGMSTGLTIGGSGTSFSADLITTGGRWELAATLGLHFDTGALKPTDVVTALENALSGLFDAIGQDSVVGSIASIGNALVQRLSGLDAFLSFSAAAQVGVEAGIDIKPLIDGTGSPQLFLRVQQFNMSISAAITDFTTPMDFGGSFDFTGIVNGEIVFSAVASGVNASNPLVLLDASAGVDNFTITPLTDAISLGGSIVAEVELAGGPLDSSLFLGVEDLALFDSTAPKFTVDAEIPREMMQVVRDGLAAMGDVGRDINGFDALTTTLPLMNRTLHDVLKTGETGPNWGDFLIWDTVLDQLFADPAYAGCLDGSTSCPRARETVQKFTDGMANLTQGSFTSDTGVPAAFVNGGMVGKEFQLAFGLNGNLEVLVTPPLSELIDDDDFDFTGTGVLTVGINFGFGFEVKVDTTNGAVNVTTDDIVLRLDNFTMGLTIGADVSATASIGILSASVSNGTGVLAADFGGSMNAGAPLKLSEVTKGNFAFTKSATLDACLPFSAAIGSQDLGELAGATGAEKPQVCVNDSNLFDSTAPTVQTLFMDRFMDFRGMSPIQIMGIVRGLINVVQEYRESPVFDLALPFTDVDVGDMLDFTDTLTTALSNKMVKVQDAADRTTLVLCVEGDALTTGWNVPGTNESAYFFANVSSKVMSLVLNEELEVEVALNATVMSSATTIADLALHLNEELYKAGLGLSVAASVPVEGVESLQLCTNASIKATDLRVQIAQKKTGNSAYNESDEAVAATTLLGFTSGDIKEAPRVAAFSSIPELVIVLAEAVGVPSDVLSYTYGPSAADPSQYELLFALDLTVALPTPMTSLLLGAEVEPLFSVNASAEIALTTDVQIGFEIGARMGTSAGNLSVTANIPAAQEFANFTLASEQSFNLSLDRVLYTVVLRPADSFYDELDYQLGVLNATLGGAKQVWARNYENTTFLIQTLGVRRLEVTTSAEFEALTGLASDKAKALLFTPVVKNLAFTADMMLTVSEINLAATLAVLEAEAYAGSGYIGVTAIAEFGTSGTAMLLGDLRDAIIEDPFSQIAANATVSAELDVEVSVGIPSLGSVSGTVGVVMNPPFFVELKENFSLPNASTDFEVTIGGVDLPDFKNLTLADIIALVSDGVDLLFGNTAVDPVVEGLLSDLPLLDLEIPLISFTPRTMVTQIQTVLGTLEGLLANQTGSVERIELLIEEALGLPAQDGCTGSCLVGFTFADSKLLLEVNFEASPTLPELSFDINLKDMMGWAGISLNSPDLEELLGEFIDLEAKLAFALSGGASATLQLGVDISSRPFRMFVGGGTALQVNVLANATGSLTLTLGPVEFGIENGYVAVTNGTDHHAAYLRYGLTEGTNYYLDEGFSNIVKNFSLTSAGKVSAELPITGIDTMLVEIPRLVDFLNKDSSNGNFVEFPGGNISSILESIAGPLLNLNPIAAILTDKEAVLNGVDGMFTKIDLAITAADGVLGSMDVPIVKNKIREVIQEDFIGKFQTQLRGELESALSQVSEDSMAQILRNKMVDFFSGLGILKGGDIPIVIRKKDGTVLPALEADGSLISGYPLDEADAVEWDVTLGKDILFATQFDFDLGLSELPLKLTAEGGVELLVGWDFKLFFGMSVSRGFYLNVSETEMAVYASLKLPGLKATGDLFILEASITNRDDTTELKGLATVDVGETDGDGYLTFKEVKSGGASLVRANAAFEVVVGMDLSLGLSSSEGLPRFTTSLYTYYGASWEQKATKGTAAGETLALGTANESMSVADQGPASGTLLMVDVGLDLGEFVTNILKPIFAKLSGFLGPIRPILEALQKPLPVVSDLAGRDVSLLALPEILINGLLGAGGPVRGSVKNVLAYVSAIAQVIDLAIAVLDVIDELATWEGNLKISFGNWQINKDGFSRYPDTEPLPANYPTTGRYAQVQDDSEPLSSASSTGSSKMKNLMSALTNPDAIFNLPFLSASGVMGLITGKDVDLFVVQTPVMEIDVTIDFWFPLAAGILVVDFYGSFQFRARVSMGYDTSGIRRAIEQGKPELALDGFFLSDTDIPTGTGGVDIPELYAAGTVRIGATLNLLLAKLSGSGELSFTGSIDLYDPNDDGKIRFSEIKSIIEAGSFLDIFNIKIKMCAGASFSVDLFNPFVNWKCKWYGCWPRGRWESVYRFSVYKCFLELDTTPPALPILATVGSNTLQLNMGPRAGDRVTGDTADKGEYFTIRYVNGAAGSEEVEVLFGVPPASGQDDNRQAQEFTDFLAYSGSGGKFSDTILVENPVSRGVFDGGDDSGYDRLILDFSGVVTDLPEGTLSDGQITGFGMSGTGIQYSNFEEVTIYLNGQANLVTITGSTAGTKLSLYLNGGNDKVVVTAGAAMAGDVNVVGGNGQDTLYVLSSVGGAGTLYSTWVSLPSMSGQLTFSTIDVLRVTLTSGVDTFVVDSTPAGASVEVQAAGGADTITVGSGSLSDIVSPVKVSGSSVATLVIDDSMDTATGNVGELTATRVTGLGMSADGVVYSAFVKVEVKLPTQQPSTFTISATHSGETVLTGGAKDDTLTVSGVSGETWVNAGDGEDSVIVPVTTEGDVVLNRISQLLHLDGQNGNDSYSIGFSGTGQSRIELSDTGYTNNNGAEANVLVVGGTAADDTILFRKNFIALIHSDRSEAERLDIDRTINGGITVNGLAGDDSFITDGTAGIVTQNGGAGNDRFLIGQLYNSLRVEANMSEPADAFDTTETTEGYLSDGNGEHMNCNGESGEDTFVVMRNLGTLSLRGGVGNDRFTVRAFALAGAEDQSQPDSALGETEVATDEGDDVVYYTINAPVTIDGGPGFDTLVAIGTEFPDTFVITKDGIYGSGLYITFVGIESVELNTAAGDDTIYVMSTAAHVQTNVYGGLGSDVVYITPRYSVPVSSSDLRGHNGIVEHAISSATDSSYDGLEAHGVTAYITDQDNASIAIVVPTEIQLVEESSGDLTGVYYLRMGHAISGSGVNDSVTVNIVVPGAPSEIPGAASVTVSPNIVSFTSQDWFVPRAIVVTVTTDHALEGNEVIFLGHAVVQLSNLDGYDTMKIPSVPVRIIDADQAELYILETPDTTTGMRVSESGLGEVGTSVEYDVVLRPCVSGARPQDVDIAVSYDAAQVVVEPATFSFSSESANPCRQTVRVTAVNDTLVEGFHFVALNHEVTVAASNAVFYSASLAADAVNVEILDNDAPALVVLESGGTTEMIEGWSTDSYNVYLTKAPVGEVTVDVNVVASEVWGKSSLTRVQVTVSPTSIVFDASNYTESVTVTVTPIGDEIVDQGETTQQFASQPALAYQIQGALTVGGGEADGAVTTLKAIMYPGELDIEAYPGQTNPWLTVREEQQVDRLVVENTGGFLPTTVTLTEGRITGMGMGESRVLAGTTVLGGVTYTSMEEVVVNLGPAKDDVIVNGTHLGATYVNAGKDDDTFTVLAAHGPVVLNGSTGNDNFTFGAGDGLLGGIKDMVVADGGEGTDWMWVNNTQGNPLGDAGFLTRSELTGLGMYATRDSSSVIVQVVAVRGTSGSFGLSFTVDGVAKSLTFAVGTSAETMEADLQAAVFPVSDVCGTAGIGACVQSFAVDRLPWGYVVRYVGELAVEGTASAMVLDTTNVVGAEEELLDFVRIDSRPMRAGMLYVGVESVDIDLATDLADTLNIRGTSVPTVVRSHAGDDTFVVGSDALVLSNTAATTVQKVEGRLDYVEALLTLDGGSSGRTRLLVSDSVATAGKPAVALTAGLITGLAPADIVYTGADYSRGVTLWLSAHADTVVVSSTFGSEANVSVAEDVRTITQLFTGAGADKVTVALADKVNGFFVVGTEAGDDVVDASTSTLPLVIVGGFDDDTILAGLGDDIIFGDTGNLILGGVDTVGVPEGSTAAQSGVLSLRSSAFTDHVNECAAGGNDTITAVGTASYLVFGGDGNDTITTDAGEDVVFADYGFAAFTHGDLTRAESACSSAGGADVVVTASGHDVVLGGNGVDTLTTAAGADVVVGDHGSVVLAYPGAARLVTSVATTIREAGEGDFIYAGEDADIVLGGVGADTVYAGTGDDVVFGDAGVYTALVAGDFSFASSETDMEEATGTGDVLFGERGDDILVGGQGVDTLWGADGNDWLFGDHAGGSVTPSISTEVTAFTTTTLAGGADVLHGEGGHDVVMGGHANDEIFGADGSDVLFGDYGSYTANATHAVAVSADASVAPGANTIAGEGDADYIFGGSGVDNVTGGDGDDWVFGDNGLVSIAWGTQAGTTLDDIAVDDREYTRARAGHVSPMQLALNMSTTVRVANSTDAQYGAADTIVGNDGNDAIFGGNDVDVLSGDDNEDVIFGDHGSVTVDGYVAVLTSTQTDVEANGDGDEIHGNNGDDFLFGGQGSDNITGDAGNDIVFGDHGEITLTPLEQTWVYASIAVSGGAADLVETHDGDDVVFGGAGGDVVDTSVGNDVVFGDHGRVSVAVVSTGHNLTTYASQDAAEGGDDTIVADDGDDVVFGGAGADVVTGDDGADVIFGDHGSVAVDGTVRVMTSTQTAVEANGAGDEIHGNNGDDFLFGGQGSDNITGNAGSDVVFGDHGEIILTPLEQTVVYASIAVSGGAADLVETHDGDDVVFGGAGGDVVDTSVGDDVVFGDHGRVSVALVDGHNVTVYASQDVEEGGDDVIVADDGDDVVFGGAGADDVTGNNGVDVIFGDHGSVMRNVTTDVYVSTSAGFGGADTLSGNNGSDFLFGGADGDTINGDDGDDVVFGDSGIVTLVPTEALAEYESQDVADGGADVIETHAGQDTVFGGVDTDNVVAGTEDDVVFGDNGHVRVHGSVTLYESVATTDDAWGGADVLAGDAGNDVIFGGQEADNITGAAGDDWVFGDHGRVVLRPASTDATESNVELESTSTSSGAYGGADLIDTHAGADYVFGGQGADEITTADGADVVFGDHGAINLTVAGAVYESTATEVAENGGADTIDTGADDDYVFGGQVGDIVHTHGGEDTVFGDFGRITVAAAGLPIVEVSISAEHGGRDVVTTGDGEDHVFGGADADSVHSGEEADVVFGDHGTWYSVAKGDVVLESLFTEAEFNGGNDDIVAASGNDIVLGGQGDDNITGNAGDDWLLGDQGRVVLRKEQTITSTAETSGGDDTISGDEGADYIMGGVGADTLFGGADEDFIFGDSGHIAQARDATYGTRTFAAIFVESEFGGDDTIVAGTEDDFVMGQQGADTISGGDGMDMLFGDHAEAELRRADHEILWAQTTAPVVGRGGDDTIFGENGEDYLFGGAASDTLHGGDDEDVILGDHALFNGSFRVLHQYRSIFTQAGDAGANDTIHGGKGDDMILGQQGGDVIFGDEGEDDITGGHDVLDGVDGDDVIHGGSEADVVLGDNGLIDRALYVPRAEAAPVPLTPSPVVRPLFCDDYVLLSDQMGAVNHPQPDVSSDSSSSSNSDSSSDSDSRTHTRDHREAQYGPNENKCWVTGCIGDSVRIEWSRFATERRYDLVSLYTVASNGSLALEWELSGWDLPESSTYTQDVLVRFSSDGYTHDLGFELTYACSAPTPVPSTAVPAAHPQMYASPPPYVNDLQWQRYPGAARYADVVRLVQRYDDVDLVAGNDTIFGDGGDDILHGQRGNDVMDGGDGEDEVFGEQGSDVLHGGAGADVVLGDMGHVVRAFTEDGEPRVNTKTGAWHRNVVLEEQAMLTHQWVDTWRDAHFTPEEATALLDADVLLALGGYERDGETKKLEFQSTRRPWRTALAGLRLLESGNDEIHGDAGDDVLIGQRGDDVMAGGDGDDFVYGDTVSSVYHYDSCLPLVTTVVRVLRAARDEEAWKVDLPFYGAVTNIPMWIAPEQTSRASVLRPVDDAALGTLVPEDMMMMLDAVAAGDLELVAADAVMRPFAAVVPDVLRHGQEVSGNDDLSGGAGNDVVVGDAAFHHALLNLRVDALDEMRERTAARWGELQFRLARMSVDAGTFLADTDEAAVAALATAVHSGNDKLAGGNGSDTLAGDKLEAFTDVVYHEHFAYTGLKQTVKELMLTYADYETVAVDAGMALFEAHHSIIQELYANRRNGKAAPASQLFLANDELDGGAGDDVVVGDSLLLMAKGLFLNHTHDGNYFTQVGKNSASKSKDDEDEFKELLETLKETLAMHVKRDFWASDSIDGGNLKKRWEWNSLPYTKWGCDTIEGGDGKDSLLGDYGLVVVATFEGAPFHPSTEYGLRGINTALNEHLDFVEKVIEDRVTRPALKSGAQELDDVSFDASLKGLSFYHNKGRGVYGHDEPESASQSDEIHGGDGEDMLSGSNGVAVVPMWRQTNSLVSDPIVEARRSFFSVLDSDHWKRMEAYEKRDRSFDEDKLTGGADRDVFLVQNLKEDSVQDKEHWVDSIYYRPAFAYIGDILRDAYVGAVHGTCLNELSLDGVLATKAIHKFLDLPVAGWHGIFGVVWSHDQLVEPVYYLQNQHHVHLCNKDHDGHTHTDDAPTPTPEKSNEKSDCQQQTQDSWKALCECRRSAQDHSHSHSHTHSDSKSESHGKR